MDLVGDDVVPAPIVELEAIDVEIDAITDFITLLRAEVDENLRPYSDRIIGDHRSGVGFGNWSVSEPMRFLRSDYHTCLVSATDGLRSYIEASEVLLAAADKIAQHYRDTDAFSAAQSQDVLAALNVSQSESDARERALAAEHARRETEREQRRLQR